MARSGLLPILLCLLAVVLPGGAGLFSDIATEELVTDAHRVPPTSTAH
jgi:hypothetical protein